MTTVAKKAAKSGARKIVPIVAAGAAAVAVVVGVVVVAGGGDDKSSSPTTAAATTVVTTAESVATTAPSSDSTTATTGATTPTSAVVSPTTVGEGGGFSGSIKYSISGGLSRSGELPYRSMQVGVFNGGTLVQFVRPDGGELIQIAVIDGLSIATYSEGTTIVGAAEQEGCAIDFAKNDDSGMAGSFDCSGIGAFNGTSVVIVSFRATFDVHK